MTVEQCAPVIYDLASLKTMAPPNKKDMKLKAKKEKPVSPLRALKIEDQLQPQMTDKAWFRFCLGSTPDRRLASLMRHSGSGLTNYHSLMATFTGGTPDKFYVIPIDWSVMRQKIARLKVPVSEENYIERIYPGARCVAVVKGKQYRAEIVDQRSGQWTEILLVDYGIQLKVLPNCLYSVDCLKGAEIPEAIVQMALSVRCTLADANQQHKWSERDIELFQDRMTNGGRPVRIQFINPVKLPGVASFHHGVDGFVARPLIKKPDGQFYSLSSELLGQEQLPVKCSVWADRYLWLKESISVLRSGGRTGHNLAIQQLWFLTDYARMSHSMVPPTTQLPLAECKVGMPCMFRDKYWFWHRALVHSVDEDGSVLLYSVDDGEYERCRSSFNPRHLCTLDEQPRLVRESAVYVTPAKLTEIMPKDSTFSVSERNKFRVYCPWASYDFNGRFCSTWFSVTATGEKTKDGRALIENESRVGNIVCIGGGWLMDWSPMPNTPFGLDIVRSLVEGRAKVTYLKHPGAFWLKLHHSQRCEDKRFDRINYKLMPLTTAPAVGSICLVEVAELNEKDVRAVVTDVNEEKATVRLMEYGVRMETDWSNLNSLKNQDDFFDSTFPLAFKCRLANVDLSQEWSREALQGFYSLVADKELTVKIYGCSEDGEGEMSHQVELRDRDGGNIAMQLVNEGLAKFYRTVMIRTEARRRC